MFNPWLALTFQATRLTWEAPGVMALRMMKFAGGGSTTQSEASVMIPEKAATFSEAQVVATPAVPAGSNGARTAKKVLNVNKNRVRSNKRRLAT